MNDDIKKIAVLGCGLIAESWAALFLANGFSVHAWDPDAATRAGFEEKVFHHLQQLDQLRDAHISPGRLSVKDTIADCVADVQFVQENAPENLMLKHGLYHSVEVCVAPHVIIASSTTALTWTQLSEHMTHPARLVTAHPFNPPHLIPLVEIFGVDEVVVARSEQLYRQCDKTPVRLKKDAVGHIANRLASALWREAVHIVAEGIADVSAVDAAVINGPGLRWATVGPHMSYHLGGGDGGITQYLEHLGPSQEARWQSLGSPKLTDEVKRLLITGIDKEAGNRDQSTLKQQRDQLLIALLKARKPKP